MTLYGDLKCDFCRGILRGLFTTRQVAVRTAELLGWRKIGPNVYCPLCYPAMRRLLDS